ncbi:hypothetical protein BDU57DRAFT_535461 [Ampelomyces quisqualis]|uniref:Uncharacterized protein n=1 Tax=Ampelomyces quisqualis TaxID=50730 RepID=A0A6A5R4B4_AMPQU|nr:hypothetical protein BDU57DRAFT_535461 [Ampelomyces quisqualis]
MPVTGHQEIEYCIHQSREFRVIMRYSMVYLGLVTLSSVTYSALVPRTTVSDVAVTLGNSTTASTGPEFPSKLYKFKKGDRKSHRKRANKCENPEQWTKKGKPHCAAENQWGCYRSCLKSEIEQDSKVRSGKCKKFCKDHGNPHPGDCTTSSDDDFGCTIPSIMEEIWKEEEERENEVKEAEEAAAAEAEAMEEESQGGESQGGVSLMCITKCATSFGADDTKFRDCTAECLEEGIETEGGVVDLMCVAKCAAAFGTDDTGYKNCIVECLNEKPKSP